jgi:hypothetical protein
MVSFWEKQNRDLFACSSSNSVGTELMFVKALCNLIEELNSLHKRMRNSNLSELNVKRPNFPTVINKS